MNCARCSRTLRRDPTWISGAAYGPVCARAVTGAKPKRSKRKSVPDERQQELALEVLV